MPQTAASTEQRAKALQTLIKRFLDIAWQICIEQFGPAPQMGHYSYRPRWRSDASGAGQPVTNGKEWWESARKALDLAIAWSEHDAATLGDLVERLGRMSEQDQSAVWDLIDACADTQTDDSARAALRERIRRFSFTRRGRPRDLNQKTRDRAHQAYAKLEPRDLVVRHRWLFASQWLETSAEEIEDKNYDFSRITERTHQLRTEALKQIWAERGVDGVVALLSRSGAPDTVGEYAALSVPSPEAAAEFLPRCLSIPRDLEMHFDAGMRGFLRSLDTQLRAALLESVTKGANAEDIVRVLRSAPFGEETWRLLDQYGDEIRVRYWREVLPLWNRHSPSELNELIDRLLEVSRPRAAFSAVRMNWNETETSHLRRLLRAVATTDTEPSSHYRLDPHDISDALSSLDGRPGVTSEEMAQLEFLFIEALDHTKHGIANLERQIAESPTIFVHAVALAYKRSDNAQDPPELQIDDPTHRAAAASAAHRMLNNTKRIPGTDRGGKVHAEPLSAWLSQVRQLCAQYGRAEIGDICVGELLSRSPAEGTGEWPCLPVCEVMESVASEEIARGFALATYNARDVHTRGEGGAQERELATKYRNWAQKLVFDYPYVARVLERIASTYDYEAEQHDSEAQVRKRLPD